MGLPLTQPEVDDLASLGQPLIFVGSGPPGQITVRLDDLRTARVATDHLIALGHRTIAHVTGDPDEMSAWAPATDRLRGWRSALAAAGLPARPDLEVHGDFDVTSARAAAHVLLREHPEVTAVFAASDEMAMGVALAAGDLGLRVPEDLSLVGVDGHDLGELIGLTTMVQDAGDQGVTAASMLLDLIRGEPVPGDVTFPTRLVVRRSSGPVRAGA